jgi:serine/threonine protein kinase
MEVLQASQIKVSETIVGKGAFGEVRVARWRNLDVAYKRLFVLKEEDDKMMKPDEQKTEINNPESKEADFSKEDLSQEIEMLSKLRHPNLLLFIGICKEANSPQPSIITELMSYSLYELLEIHNVQLSLPDILDISLDVCNGLDYLHKNDPPIIHRDISSKNILINGNHAKIADLGQAKLFHIAAASKQTGIPGAMAYSAPEVLTGKYTTKIDIYSFGILLCQMCHGDYPRIDRRQEQIDLAKQKFPVLSRLLSDSLSFHPNERPEAERIGQQLLGIIENDRYYPIARKLLPEKDMGILGYHAMKKQMNEKNHELITDLEKTQKLLKIEEVRWQEEAKRVDEVKEENGILQEQLETSKLQIDQLKTELSNSQTSCNQLRQDNENLISQLKFCSSEISSFQDLVNNMTLQQAALESIQQKQSQDIHSFREKEKNLMHDGKIQSEKYDKINEKLNLTIKQLNMQVDYSKDLEHRLEQILLRWKEEKEVSNQEKLKNISLNSLYSQLIQQKDQLELEYSRCDNQLRQYEGLPMPVKNILKLF